MKNIQFSKQELEFIKQYTIQEMSAFSNGVRNFADEAPAPKTEGEAFVDSLIAQADANQASKAAAKASSDAGSIGDSTFGSVANGVKNAGASWADNASKNSFNSASRGLTDTLGSFFQNPGKTWDSLGSGEKFGLVGGAAALGAIPLATFLMSKKKNKWRNTLLSMLPAAAIGAGIAGAGMNPELYGNKSNDTGKTGAGAKVDPMEKIFPMPKGVSEFGKPNTHRVGPSTPMTPISEMPKKTSPEHISAQQKFGVGNFKDIQESENPSLLANPNVEQKGPVVPPLNANVSPSLDWKPDYDKTVKGFGYKNSLDTYSPSEKQAILKSKFSGGALTLPSEFEDIEDSKDFVPDAMGINAPVNGTSEDLEKYYAKQAQGLGIGTAHKLSSGAKAKTGKSRGNVTKHNQSISSEEIYKLPSQWGKPRFGHGPISNLNDPLFEWSLPGGGFGRIPYTPVALRGIAMPTAGATKSKFSK